MLAAILTAITTLLNFLMGVGKLFTKTPTEKVAAGDEAIDKEEENVRKNGRPGG